MNQKIEETRVLPSSSDRAGLFLPVEHVEYTATFCLLFTMASGIQVKELEK